MVDAGGSWEPMLRYHLSAMDEKTPISNRHNYQESNALKNEREMHNDLSGRKNTTEMQNKNIS